MKKWGRCYIIIIAIMFVILCISSIYLKYNIDNNYTYEIVKRISFILLLLIFVSVVIFFIACGIEIIKKALHNLKECDDALFSNIDKYRNYWEKSEEGYVKQIQIINLYYQENGRVDELVAKREIGRLFARLDFLSKRRSRYENLITCFCSLVISILASVMYQLLQYKSESVLCGIGIAATLFSFGVLILLRYTVRGKFGSYKYLIEEYEKGLLLQKINVLEQSLTVTDEDEKILETKQIVIDELIRLIEKKIGKKQKEKVKDDMRCIEQLNLCLGDYSEYYTQKIYINNQACYLVYDYRKGKDNNYVGEQNLINQEYSILYEILKRYDLISYREKIHSDGDSS